MVKRKVMSSTGRNGTSITNLHRHLVYRMPFRTGDKGQVTAVIHLFIL